MKTIDWKPEYISYDGKDIAVSASYFSISGRSSATGTRLDPYNKTKNLTSETKVVLSNGVMPLVFTSLPSYAIVDIVGQSKSSSILGHLTWQLVGTTIRVRELTIQSINTIGGWVTGSYLYARDCIFKIQILTPSTAIYYNIINSIFYGATGMSSMTGGYSISYCTFVDSPADINIFKTVTPLLSRCVVNINQSAITTYNTKYMAFNACKFLIGNEATATALVGNNAVELRADFVSRCTAQGLTVPNINDFGINVPVGRWEFSNTSIAGDYDILQGSEIDVFAKLRGIYFGHTNQTVKQVPITTTLNTPASFNTQTPVKDALVSQNSIGLLANSDITKRVEAYADSKIIWLGGLAKLSLLGLVQNLPSDAGVSPDSVYGLAKVKTESGSIVAASHYIIRSSNDQIASIKYNNVVYTSSLITRNNVFLGVANITTFENTTANAELYQVIDFASHQSIQIRLMREIPSGNITTGNLQAGYWYFVEPNNLSDTSGTITYKGIVRPAFDSFLVDATNLTFTVNGTCHLRRCWKQDFDFATETTDKAFWTDRQKPNYYDIVSDDLRCLLKNNSSASVELAVGSDGVYVGSGHPDFYNAVNGATGIKLPAYNIVGSFLQIRVPITTINPM